MSILGVIGGLSGLVGSVMNSVTASRLNDKKMAFESEEAQKAREWNETMYNKYNSPIAQVQQYKDAGLNPNLLYGNGATIPQVQSSAQASSGNLENPRYGDMLGAGLSSAVDVALKKAQIENIEADTAKKESETTGFDIDNYVNGAASEFRIKLLRLLPESEFEKQQLMASQRNLTENQSGQLVAYVNSIMPLEASKLGSEIRNFDASTSLIEENKKFVSFNAETGRITALASMSQADTAAKRVAIEQTLLPYQVKEIQSRIGLNDTQAGLFYKAGLKTLFECNNLIKEGLSIDEDITSKRIDNIWNGLYGKSNDQISSLAKSFTNSVMQLLQPSASTLQGMKK